MKKPVNDSKCLVPLVEEQWELNCQLARIKSRLACLRFAMLDQLPAHCNLAVAGGYQIQTRPPRRQNAVDLEKLAAGYPDVYAAVRKYRLIGPTLTIRRNGLTAAHAAKDQTANQKDSNNAV